MKREILNIAKDRGQKYKKYDNGNRLLILAFADDIIQTKESCKHQKSKCEGSKNFKVIIFMDILNSISKKSKCLCSPLFIVNNKIGEDFEKVRDRNKKEGRTEPFIANFISEFVKFVRCCSDEECCKERYNFKTSVNVLKPVWRNAELISHLILEKVNLAF